MLKSLGSAISGILRNFVLLALTLLGTLIFLLAPGIYWTLGAGLVALAWLVYLLFVIPWKPDSSQGLWAFGAVFFLINVLIASAVVGYVQAYDVPVNIFGSLFEGIPYLDGRVVAMVAGVVGSLAVSLLFLVAVGYFTSIYILSLPRDEEVSFWYAFATFVALVMNINLPWLMVNNDGTVRKLRPRGFKLPFLEGAICRGKIIIKPGNVVVLQKGGRITRIAKPGVVVTEKFEEIRGKPFNLLMQIHSDTLENVYTKDMVPLRIMYVVGYKLRPAKNPDGPDVVKDKNFGAYPVEMETIKRAAFNTPAAGNWTGPAGGAPGVMLRDQIMTYNLDELFLIEESSDPDNLAVNRRTIKKIEDAVLETLEGGAENMGFMHTFFDVREITLPVDVTESITTRVRSMAEAEAIQRIEKKRNTIRAELVANILENISRQTGKPIGDVELRLATVFAQITRRAMTDDMLGHRYIDMLQKLADGEGIKVFTPNMDVVDLKELLPELDTGGGGGSNGK